MAIGRNKRGFMVLVDHPNVVVDNNDNQERHKKLNRHMDKQCICIHRNGLHLSVQQLMLLHHDEATCS